MRTNKIEILLTRNLHIRMARKVNVPGWKPRRTTRDLFWTHFIKLLLEHRGANREERKVFQTDSLNDSAWSILYVGHKVGLCKV